MSEIKLIEPYKSMWGKPFKKSTWWTFRRGLKLFTGHTHEGRDLKTHPITHEEHKTTERLRQASLKYQQLDHSSAEYQQLYRDWYEQRNVKGGCVSPRGLFIRREMARLKAEGKLAADPTKNLQDWSHAHATPMCDAYN